jgi:hypothetical protein
MVGIDLGVRRERDHHDVHARGDGAAERGEERVVGCRCGVDDLGDVVGVALRTRPRPGKCLAVVATPAAVRP